MMYVNDLKCMSHLFNALVQQLCVAVICGEIHLSGIAATGFAEEKK